MSLRQICDAVLRRHLRLQSTFTKRLFATESAKSKNEIVDITAAADEKPLYLREEPEILEQKRNKSRLNPYHRNILMGLRPYDSSQAWYHNTVKYKKRVLGRYGLKANDEPAGFAWPTLSEVKDAQEYERVAYPLSLRESWKKLEEEKARKAEKAKMREKEIVEKLEKMQQWRAELQAKIAKKEAALETARLRKERLFEEVRRHFGFNISPHDERFKEMLVQKEKEEKKKKKEAKKESRIMKLKNMFQTNAQDASNEQTTEQTTEPTKSAE